MPAYLSLRPYTKYLFCILLLAFVALSSAHAARQQLYAATGFAGSSGELYILDPADGSVISDVGPLNDAAGNNYGLTGLRYDASRGVLYGITGSSMTAPNSLVIVDPATALVTYVGGPFSSRFSDIALDPLTDIIYAISGSSKYFYILDKRTGDDTKIGNTLLNPHRGGGFSADALGTLYGVNDKTLYIYDKITGAATAVGDTNLSLFVGALAFNPGGVLYGVEGGGNDNGSDRQRWLVTIDTDTGAAVELGETVGDLNALAFVP